MYPGKDGDPDRRPVHLLFVDFLHRRQVAYISRPATNRQQMQWAEIDANEARELVREWRPSLHVFQHLLWGTLVEDGPIYLMHALRRFLLYAFYQAYLVADGIHIAWDTWRGRGGKHAMAGWIDAHWAMVNDLYDLVDDAYWGADRYGVTPAGSAGFIASIAALYGIRRPLKMLQKRLTNRARKDMWTQAFGHFYRMREQDDTNWPAAQRQHCMAGSNALLLADRVPWETEDAQPVDPAALEALRRRCEVVQLDDGTCVSRADLLAAKQAVQENGRVFNLYDRHVVGKRPYTRREKVLIGFLHALTPQSARLDDSGYVEPDPLPINGTWPSPEFCTPPGIAQASARGWAYAILTQGQPGHFEDVQDFEDFERTTEGRVTALQRWPRVSELAKPSNLVNLSAYYVHFLQGTPTIGAENIAGGPTAQERLVRDNWARNRRAFERDDERYVTYLAKQHTLLLGPGQDANGETRYARLIAGALGRASATLPPGSAGHLSLVLRDGGF